MKKKPTKHVLGRSIIFPASTELTNSIAGARTVYAEDTVSVVIGIGKDHTAELIMDLDALQALQDPGNEVRVDQTHSFPVINPDTIHKYGDATDEMEKSFISNLRRQPSPCELYFRIYDEITETGVSTQVALTNLLNRGEITQEEYDWFKPGDQDSKQHRFPAIYRIQILSEVY
jgi:hypothetical protein